MTRFELFKLTLKWLENGGISSKSDAMLLVALSLEINNGQVFLSDPVSKKQIRKVKRNVKKRLFGVPIHLIFKSANFYGRDFYVNKNCLCPRPETEELVHLASKNLKPESVVLDLCTGSGVIAITLAKEFGFSHVYAGDISQKALNVAKTNAKKFNANVKFIKSNLFEKLCGVKFDAIISNPPYVSFDDYTTLASEVKNFEPKIALLSGQNGLEFYVKIINQAKMFLNPNGKIFFEVGYNQAGQVAKLLEKDFCEIKILKDLEGVDRMVMATIKGV